VPLLFRKLAYAVYELEGFEKVRKLECLRDVVFFDDVPAVHLHLERSEFLTLEWRHTATAGDTGFGC